MPGNVSLFIGVLFRQSCNSIDYSSCKICLPNKTEDVSLNVFSIIREKNESRLSVIPISCNFT